MEQVQRSVHQMNEAIALFMGSKRDPSGDLDENLHFDGIGRLGGYLHNFEYHTSWDWLIPVIKKIKGMHLDILKQAFVLEYMKASGPMNSGWVSLDIEKTHQGVYQFLIWLNQQKQSI